MHSASAARLRRSLVFHIGAQPAVAGAGSDVGCARRGRKEVCVRARTRKGRRGRGREGEVEEEEEKEEEADEWEEEEREKGQEE